MKKQRLENILNGFLVVITESDEKSRDDIIKKCSDNIHDLYNKNNKSDVHNLISNKLGYSSIEDLLKDTDIDIMSKKCINFICELQNVPPIF